MNTRKKNMGPVAGALGAKASAFLIFLLAVSFFVFPRTVVSAVENPPVLTAEQAAGIREILTERVDKYHKTVGIVVGVVNERGRQVIGCGRLKRKGKEQVDGGTVFEIGSITKVFTALLLARMAEAGELSLDDPVSRFLPGSVRVPGREGKEITLLHLATHTSGLPRLPTNFFPGDMGNPYADYTAEKLYEFLSGYELKRDIGGEYSYSNLGGGLLGHALALAAGTGYETLVVSRICEPLGMHDTRITLTPGLKARLAEGHDEKGDPAGSWDFQALAGAGALRSTADDMLVFLAANLGLQESVLLPVMQKTHLPRCATGLPGVEIALGWHVNKKYGSEIVWHNGGTGGYRSFIGFDRQKRLGVVVLSSSANSMDDLGYHLLDERYELARMAPPREIELDPAVYRDYAGCYELAPGKVFTVSVEDGKLMVGLTGQPSLEVFPESETEFFYKQVDARITFHRDESARVTHLVLHQGGMDLSASRLGDDYRPPPPKKEVPVGTAILKSYVGKYELAPGAVFTVSLEDGKLMVGLTGQPSFQMFPESETGFFYKVVDAQITFEKDAKGTVSGLTLHQGGEELRAKKVE